MTQSYKKLSFWLDSLEQNLSPGDALNTDTNADIVIVGGGYTGLWTAYYLNQLDPDLEIVVLEAEIAGFGASGRNGGWCSAYLSGIEHWFDRPETRDAGIALQRHMFDAVREVGLICKREDIDAHFEQSGAIEFAINSHQLARLREEYEYMHSLGFGEEDYRWLDKLQAHEMLHATGMQAGILMAHTAAVHPARLVRGLAAAVRKKGIRLYEKSPAVSVEQGRVETPGGTVHAAKILLATEGYSDSIASRQRLMAPVHSMMVATEPLTDEQIDAIGLARRYCFGSVHKMVTYGQLTADRRIAFGCRGTYHFGSSLRTFTGSEADFDLVRNTLLSFFPSLRGVRFTHAWGGAMGVSRTLRPAVCYDPVQQLGWAGGYFGNGVGASNLAGRTLAEITTGAETTRTSLPWVNPAGANKRWEPEPLRWLGIRSARSLMHVADRQEADNSKLLPITRGILNAIW